VVTPAVLGLELANPTNPNSNPTVTLAR